MNRHLDRGWALRKMGRPQLALAEFQKALADDPHGPQALYGVATCQYDLDFLDEAEESARSCVAAAPDWSCGHQVLAWVLRGSGQYTEAETAAREALRLDPEDLPALLLVANTLTDQARWEEALPFVDRAATRDPQSAEVAHLRTHILYNLGRRDDAAAAARRALELSPEDRVSHNNVGWTLLHTGDAGEALPHFREALRLDPAYEQPRMGISRAVPGEESWRGRTLRAVAWVERYSLVATGFAAVLLPGTIIGRLDVHPGDGTWAAWEILGCVGAVTLIRCRLIIADWVMATHPLGRLVAERACRRRGWFVPVNLALGTLLTFRTAGYPSSLIFVPSLAYLISTHAHAVAAATSVGWRRACSIAYALFALCVVAMAGRAPPNSAVLGPAAVTDVLLTLIVIGLASLGALKLARRVSASWSARG